MRAATWPDGRIDSLPVESGRLAGLLQQADLCRPRPDVPENVRRDAGHRAQDQRPKQGHLRLFVARGVKNANVPVWTSLLLGQDQETVTPDGKTLSLTDTPQAVWSGRDVPVAATRHRAPPGVVGFNWNECQTSFMQGKIGMWMGRCWGSRRHCWIRRQSRRSLTMVGFGGCPPDPRRIIVRCSPMRWGSRRRARRRRPRICILSVGDQQADASGEPW